MQQGSEHAYCGLPLQLSNFQGHFQCDKSVLVGRPGDWQEAAALVKAFDRVKAVGVGHSWWRQQFCSGTNASAINIVTTEFTNVLPALQGQTGDAIRVNESSMTVTAAAGVTQRTLLKYLDAYRTSSAPDGYTLPAFSWFIDQTIGGAVATATHGSSLLWGSLSSQLKRLKLMDAQGAIRQLSPEADPHLWKAAAVSVGRLGITLEVTLSIVKNKPVRRDKTDISVEVFQTSIKELQWRYSAALAAGNSLISSAVWEAVKPWHEVQLFWFIPSNMLWKVSFTHLDPDNLDDQALLQVLASDGPEDRLPRGAHQQLEVKAAGTGAGIEVNPLYWSDLYRLYLSVNVEPAVLPARESFVSISELENRMYAAWNSYDQYEVAVPLDKAADCLAAVTEELYGSNARWRGFRSPALVRFIRAESAYLSPAHNRAVMYVNMEDHLSYSTGAPNTDFQAVLGVFRSPVCGNARLHWGKAGWRSPQAFSKTLLLALNDSATAAGRSTSAGQQTASAVTQGAAVSGSGSGSSSPAPCFDGAVEYPDSWCDFGCAVHQLDPTDKFAGEAGDEIWQWTAQEVAGGADVQRGDFGAVCCGAGGFDRSRCRCVPRRDCKS